MHLLCVVGTRPNFVKAAALLPALRGQSFRVSLVHTGQHRVATLSAVFFAELGLPTPTMHLEVGGTPLEQHAQAVLALAPVVRGLAPDAVVVVGDVTSTLAGALVAAHLGVRVAHVEAGLRCFDRGMAEERNRVLVDHLAHWRFASEESAMAHLAREGLDGHLVGNVVIDTLRHHLPRAAQSRVLEVLDLEAKSYEVLTLHRAETVDDPAALGRVLAGLAAVPERRVWPLHPRTRARLVEFGLWEKVSRIEGLQVIDPLGYLDFVRLVEQSRGVLTDSGGVQEEALVLRVPCLTLRASTERPSTVVGGGNRLVGTDPEALAAGLVWARQVDPARFVVPPTWDGRAAERIATILAETINH